MTADLPGDLPFGPWWLTPWANLLAGYHDRGVSRLTLAATLLAAHGSEFMTSAVDVDTEVAALGLLVEEAIAAVDAGLESPTDPIQRWQSICVSQLKLTGDTRTYHVSKNSFLPDIRRRRVGIPIGLAVVWLHVAEVLGIHAYGVGMPGHFLVGARSNDGEPVYFDCFGGGRRLSQAQCMDLYESMFAGREHPSFINQFLNPVSEEAILTRMIANLKQNAARRRDLMTLLDLARLRWFLPLPSLDDGRELVRLCVAMGLAGEARYWLDAVIDRFGAGYPAAQRIVDTKIVRAAFN